MILSDSDIRNAIANGRIQIEPFDEADVQPSSVDLHVDRFFRVFHNARYPYIDVKKPMEGLTEIIEVASDEPFILHPGEFVLGSTAEYVKLPSDLVARLEGKSSLGRLGLLIHSSLPADEEVLFLHDGLLHPVPIGDIVRKRLEGSVVAFDPKTFAVSYHPVTGWHETAPDRIFEIELASGRKVRLTGAHSLFSLDAAGNLVKLRVHELTMGTFVAIARSIPDPRDVRVELSLLHLAPESALPGLVCGGPTVESVWTENRDTVRQSLKDLGIGHADYYERRQVLPAPVLMQFRRPPALTDTDWVAARGGKHRLPAIIDVDKELAWFLGLYVAEGYRRRKQVVIANTDPTILDRAQSVLRRIGLPVTRVDGWITCSSAVFSFLLSWIGVGGHARAKRIPKQALGWDSELLTAFYSGFVDGDGSIQPTQTSLWTSSSRLVGDLLLVCARLGMRASASVRERATGPLWQISVPYREHKLLNSVPNCPQLFAGVRHESGLTQKDAAQAAGFGYPTQLNNIERASVASVRPATINALRDAYSPAGTASLGMLDRLVEGNLAWDRVKKIRDTRRVEPVFDLEIRPRGRRIENFLAGSGGVFISNTAGYVDPGFEGHLTLELSNVANLPITIYPGMKIGQISFFQLTSEAENPYGSGAVGSKYQGQRGPTASRYYENFHD